MNNNEEESADLRHGEAVIQLLQNPKTGIGFHLEEPVTKVPSNPDLDESKVSGNPIKGSKRKTNGGEGELDEDAPLIMLKKKKKRVSKIVKISDLEAREEARNPRAEVEEKFMLSDTLASLKKRVKKPPKDVEDMTVDGSVVDSESKKSRKKKNKNICSVNVVDDSISAFMQKTESKQKVFGTERNKDDLVSIDSGVHDSKVRNGRNLSANEDLGLVLTDDKNLSANEDSGLVVAEDEIRIECQDRMNGEDEMTCVSSLNDRGIEVMEQTQAIADGLKPCSHEKLSSFVYETLDVETMCDNIEMKHDPEICVGDLSNHNIDQNQCSTDDALNQTWNTEGIINDSKSLGNELSIGLCELTQNTMEEDLVEKNVANEEVKELYVHSENVAVSELNHAEEIGEYQKAYKDTKDVDENLSLDKQFLDISNEGIAVEDIDSVENQKPDAIPKFENQSKVARLLRNVKKPRYGDMAYEGDDDWDLLSNFRNVEKFDSSNFLEDEISGSAAAVAAGLKASAAGLIEQIKFKEVLKRRGGLQQYLDCRNFILSLWSKDVKRILRLEECGVSSTPVEDESPRASLIREVFAFLDGNGYINAGIASDKSNSVCLLEPVFSEESKPMETSAENVSFKGETSVLINAHSSLEVVETSSLLVPEDNNHDNPSASNVSSESSTQLMPGKHVIDNVQVDTQYVPTSEAQILNSVTDGTNTCLNEKYQTIGSDHTVHQTEKPCGNITISSDHFIDPTLKIDRCEDVRKRVIVVGAGPAGLTAARHLERRGFSTVVLEARDRVGGRVHTDRSSLSVPVDLGASIITGVEADVTTERRPDPSSLICKQLGIELTVLNSDCPLYDIITGEKVPHDLDGALEAEYNSLLDDMVPFIAQKGENANKMSLEDGLEHALRKRRLSQRKFAVSDTVAVNDIDNFLNGNVLRPLERRVFNWHFANLEYGCAAPLKQVSLSNWNQDDLYGGFGGAHCMIKGGYSTIVESIGGGLNIHLNHVVTEIEYGVDSGNTSSPHKRKVKVRTSNGCNFVGDAVLITVPLGCLKANTIRFSPPLPIWKDSSIRKLGFGVLNKVALEFPHVFWDDAIDYFGATAEETGNRGQCFMFWNVKKTVGAPVLIALVVGQAALDGQTMSKSEHVNHALKVLRKLFGEASVPNPVASVVTNWGLDPFSRGAYSYVAIGASGDDYDTLGKPVENCLFFAGEATCKEHPDTVGGAMMSGLREAVRIFDILTTGYDYAAEVEAMEAVQRESDNEITELKDMIKRLEAYKYTNATLVRDLFYKAKTTSGRLHLIKEMLNLPVKSLKSFAGTKQGLNTLNSWILDSLGKNATQLLRHCVRLLVLVSTDLLAVRLSGIGKTVKEKVCVHTSRDIRSIASQLVNVWIDVFRKEKAASGRLKLLQESSKSRPKDLSSGKIGPNNDATKSRHISKKTDSKNTRLENVMDTNSEANSSRSQSSFQCQDLKMDRDEVISEEEAAAIAAAEAAHAAALAAAEAFASSEANISSLHDLPKIPSFHKFVRRDQYTEPDDSEFRRRISGSIPGRQDCVSDIDSRNCKTQNWTGDFTETGANLDNSSQRSNSNDLAPLNIREHSEESTGLDRRHIKAWVDTDTVGSGGVKDYLAIERWQSQAMEADAEFYQRLQLRDGEDSNGTFSTPPYKSEREGSSASQVVENKLSTEDHPRGADHIKQGVMDFVASLLRPLYKTRKIDRDGYKSIMKKTVTKVMEQCTEAEKRFTAPEFLDYKRKIKIRTFVDKLIERHMATARGLK